MNISTPFPSQVRSVDFGFLSRSDIRKLSVKRIHHTEAINRDLGFPIPGGLYDPALGTRGDYQCTTCNLGFLCPGHAGHIELPSPIYHPVFMDQLMKLLNAQCGSCMKFRISDVERHAFCCKLKLLRYGLVEEAKAIDSVNTTVGSKAKTNGTDAADDSDNIEGKGENHQQATIGGRNRFMIEAFKKHGGKKFLKAQPANKVEALVESRRELIKDLFLALKRSAQCPLCNGYSHKFRKDGFNKIFKQPISDKYKQQNMQLGIRLIEPVLERAKVHSDAAAKKRQRKEMEDDEGIAMEVDDFSAEESEEGADDDTALSRANLLDSEAITGSKPPSKSSETSEKQQEYITPAMVLGRIEELFREENDLLELLYQSRHPSSSSDAPGADMFFIHDILVTPNKYRPDMKTGAGMITEAEQNKSYSDVISAATEYSDIKRDLRRFDKGSVSWQRAISRLQQSLIRMQDTVNSLIDSDKNPSARAAARAPEGIKQKLEKKEGLFRMNMMGKRVNFAARSVISPDPNIETNEIGVPPVFAKKLTYPEPVTNHNFYEMKQAVLNGPETWPGAAAVENENGQLINLKYKNYEERQAIANQLLAPSNTNVNGARNKKVHRHLNNGDIVIMNRQPTLHKPSMMCHRARVLPGEKTIRMHYANCNTYNADFDGDEMNMHFPQNESARAEAILIADTNHQYLSATAGKPLRGLIQDHLSMGVWLSNKDTFFDRADYHQLLYSCLRPEQSGVNIITVPPAVFKPRALWTGKQIVTTILANIKPVDHAGLTMTGKSQVPAERWMDSKDKTLPTEAQVIFKDGDLLCGILDKAQLGPAKGGLVHSVYEAYGDTIAGSLLSILGRMLTKFEHMRAFSCGMEDIVLTKDGNSTRRELLKEATKVGHEVATKYVSLDDSRSQGNKELLKRLEDVLRDDKKQHGLDIVYNARTALVSSGITKGCLPHGLFKAFPRNQMQTMTVSGAKGSAVNANLISCNLGQQVLEGRRTPTMVSGKTLPAFKPFETAVRAGGYITNRFLTGVQPQEYYFHTMAGREGLIDTAVKTSRSGYLQRCIIKGMEGLQVHYDTTVRDSDGSVVQFLYGEDGLDITKQVHLTNFKFQVENWKSAVENLNMSDSEAITGDSYDEDVVEASSKAMRKYTKTGDLAASDPVTSLHNPSSTWGCTSEKFTSALKDYVKKNPDKLLRDKATPDGLMPKKQFRMMLEMMYMRAVIEPGEPVGIVAGQSIGEPSTQMTLNTFHLAGHSAKNVTLGIPRLREIVMTATANLATPQMKMYLDDDVKPEDAEKFVKGIHKRTVADVIDKITVTERIGAGKGYARAKIYDVRLDFFPAKEYKELYRFTEEDLASAIEIHLLLTLERLIRKEIKDKGLVKTGRAAAQPVVGKSYNSKESARAGPGKEGDPSSAESAQKEQDRTEDATSEESDMDDEPDEDNPKRAVDAYEDDEDDRDIAKDARAGSVDPDERDAAPHEDEGYAGSSRSADSSDDEDEPSTKPSGAGAVAADMAKWRTERIVGKDNSVSDFKWDVKSGQWCEFSLEYDIRTDKILMLNLVETACRKAVVQHITNIESATLATEKIRDDETNSESEVNVVIVEGNNLTAMHGYQNIINPHKIFTNDIVAMMNVYGVEAGRATIVREMNAVFDGHNINVDLRHLNLIADHMTRSGEFLAFSRTGMKNGVSPFSKMSFETTVGFLKDAVLEQDFDDLSGPSARIVSGRPGKVGTGAFDVLHRVA